MTEPACWSWPIPDDLPDDPRDALFAWQARRCAVCGRDYSAYPRLTLIVEDHDHATGKVRGLLCRRDNAREVVAKDQTLYDLYRSRPPTALLGRTYDYYTVA